MNPNVTKPYKEVKQLQKGTKIFNNQFIAKSVAQTLFIQSQQNRFE